MNFPLGVRCDEVSLRLHDLWPTEKFPPFTERDKTSDKDNMTGNKLRTSTVHTEYCYTQIITVA